MMPPTSDSGRPKDPSDLATPPRVPEHELIRCVGAGSYGQVWLARSVLGSWRAVKVVHRRLFREDRPYDREYLGVQRFEPLSREDDGFVDILQTGRNDEGGYFYYVMELADDVRTPSGRWDGDPTAYEPRTLAWVLAEQERLSLEECVELGLSLCRALGRLHDAGLIHRDVKPSNVIYVDDRPRLADIGLVVEQSEASSWVGTEGFIPPEGPNSPQADIYSLGKVLYVAMTGMDRADFPLPPLGLGTGADGGRLLELNSILLRACAAAVGARYATAAEMVSDLELIQSGGSVRKRRRRGASAFWRMAGVGVLIGVVGFVGVWWGRWMREREAQFVPVAAVATLGGKDHDSSVSLLTTKGMRRLDEGDESAALLYFCEALAAATAAGEPTEIHRLRVGVVRDRLPQLAAVIDVGGEVCSVDFSPDGRLVAIADIRGTVTVWEASTGRRLYGPHEPSGFPVKVRVAPDGLRLFLVPEVRLPALRGVDKPVGTARVLDLATGLPMAPEVSGVFWGVFSPDGRWLVTMGTGNRMELRSVGEMEPIRVLESSPAVVSWMEFSPDGKTLAAVSDDAAAWLWTVPEGTQLGRPLAIGGYGMRVVFSPSGSHMATLAVDAARNWMARVWDWSKGQMTWQLAPFASSGPILDFGTPDGSRMLTGNGSGALSLHTLQGPSVGVTEIRSGMGTSRGWVVSADGSRAAVGSEDGSVKVWDLADARVLTPVLLHPHGISKMAMSPKGSTLLTATREGVVRIWDLAQRGAELEPIEMPGAFVHIQSPYVSYPNILSASGEQVLFGMQRNGARVPVALDIKSGRELPLPTVGDLECGVLVSGQQHGSVAMYRRGDPFWKESNDVLLLRMQSNRWQTIPLPHPELVIQAEFLEDDRWLMTLDTGCQVRCWDTASAQLLWEESLPVANVDEICLFPDGRSVGWLDDSVGKLVSRSLSSKEDPVRFLPLPKALLGESYPRRACFLAALTRDWPQQDWSGSSPGTFPFRGLPSSGCRVRTIIRDLSGCCSTTTRVAQYSLTCAVEWKRPCRTKCERHPSARFALIQPVVSL